MNKPWTYEFREMGGYDCMTDAFNIRDSKDNLIACLDFADAGYNLKNDERKEQLEELANFICKSCNDAVSVDSVQKEKSNGN